MATNETTVSKGFERVNFFKGFVTTVDDWNHVVSYNVEKARLNNRLFHGPGIVDGELGSLKVSARGRADLSVEIHPGYALDGAGNVVYLPEPEIKTINPGDFKLPQTVYIVLKYIEELTDFVSYKANLEYKGHRRVSERFKIEAIITEPDLEREVELARINMTKGVKRITDPKDPFNPRDNEIDSRYRPIAGNSDINPTRLYEMLEMIRVAKDVYGHMFHNLKIMPAADVHHGLITLDMLLRSRLINNINMFTLWWRIFDLQNVMVADIESNHPQFSSKKEFASYKKHVELLDGMYTEGKVGPEFLTNIIGYQSKSTENLASVFSAKVRKKKVEADTSGIATDAIWEKLKVKSDEFDEKVTIDGVTFKRVDWIDLLNKKSEKDHKFRIVDARDKYRTRQKLKYPDGVIVEDVGIAYEGGYAEWEVSNVTPNKDVYVIMRMDYVHGDWEAEMQVNGKKVGNWQCVGEDRKFRWRNLIFKVEARYVGDTFLSVRQTPVKEDRDINMFKLWFYQPA